MQQSLQIDAMWRGTSLMGLPHASTNLSQAAESPEDVLERNVQDPTFVSLESAYYSKIILYMPQYSNNIIFLIVVRHLFLTL